MMQQILSVSDINKYIKGLLSYDSILSSVWVQGEISNYKRHYSGHLYFTLKDAGSSLKCVMFKTSADRLLFEPENGMRVLIRGSISVFERDGVYQLYAETIKEDGTGEMYAAFERLKGKLEKEGLFDKERKKSIPFMPRSIGVITSETGAVIRDILNVLTRRFYNINLKLYPCAVQGEGASAKIAAGVEFFNRHRLCDVIIIARGGGSIEDLWPFNEEIVARAVADSNIPVISGVGHETDFTICDFAADLRAPTPSAAAELAVPEMSEIKRSLERISERIRNIPKTNLEIKRTGLGRILASPFFKKPYSVISDGRLTVEKYAEELEEEIREDIQRCKNNISLSAARLDGLSPLKILARGYGAVRSASGDIVGSVESIKKGDEISVSLRDGNIECTVNNVFRGDTKND